MLRKALRIDAMLAKTLRLSKSSGNSTSNSPSSANITLTVACATDLNGDAFPDVFVGTFSQPFSTGLRVGPWGYVETQATQQWAGVRATSCVALDADGAKPAMPHMSLVRLPVP